MGDFGFWIFCSVVAFCILLYKLAQLRNEHEDRLRQENFERIDQITKED